MTLSRTTATLFAFAALMLTGGQSPAFAGEDVIEQGALKTSAGIKAATAASTLSLSTSVTVALAPAQVTHVATVGGTALKGDIAFKSGTVTLAIVAINKNTATATVELPAAIHWLTAVYTASAGEFVSPPAIVVVDNRALACS